MSSDNWLKQDLTQPLFSELLWSRPENRMYAGKLFIIGGHAQSFAAPAQIYNEAEKAGIGSSRVLLPDALRKTVGPVLMEGEFAISTPSGSFSNESLGAMLEGAVWSDGTIIAGDLGRNSETAIVLEKLARKYTGQLTITKDGTDYFTTTPEPVLDRENTCLVLSFSQLRALGQAAHFTTAFTFDMDLIRLVTALQAFTTKHKLSIVTKHLNQIIVAMNGRVSTTKIGELPIWRCHVAAHVAVWWAQNPSKPFEAISTAVTQACA